MDEPKLTLFSDGLLSKFGFNDGDAPDDVLDWLEANGHGWRIDWHTVLTALVERYLLPAIKQDVKIVHISTNHNPVRAQTVDGVDITGYYSDDLEDVELTPEYVEIPMSEVARIAAELGAIG